MKSGSTSAVTAMAVLAAGLIGSSAQARGWSVIILQPASANTSNGSGCTLSGGQQVGEVKLTIDTSVDHAALWTGSAESFIDLNPEGVSESSADAADDGQQVGTIFMPGQIGHAALWTGTAASVIDLHPAGAESSFGNGVSNGRQSGYAFFPGPRFSVSHAIVWSGTAESFVDLHPSGVDQSSAADVHDDQVVGYVLWGIYPDHTQHATLWVGDDADSYINLNPEGSSLSEAFGVSGCQQAGYVKFDGDDHAALWTGTAESFVDLNPSGAEYSWLSDTTFVEGIGGIQSGGAGFDRIGHAGIWKGTADSFVDLHLLLPAEFTTSSAEDIEANAKGEVMVTGFASGPKQPDAAILWMYTPDIAGDITGNGVVDVDDLLALINAWGECPQCPTTNFCAADLNHNGTVDVDDLLIVINQWSD